MDALQGLSWPKQVQLGLLLLVSVGFGGEVFGDWFSRPIRKRLDAGGEAQISGSTRKAEAALAAATAASERATGLEVRVAQLELELETQRSKENRTKLVACLRTGPKGPMVVVPTSDEEAEAYARQIKEVLQEAKFEMRPLQGQRPSGFGVPGAFLVVRDSSNPPSHIVHVQSCFQKFGVKLNAVANPRMVTDPTNVVVAVSSEP